jgi:hypothetical protein
MDRDYGKRVVSIMRSNAFTCHWDESGVDPGTKAVSKSDREVLMVAGYMAHVSEWEILEDRWNAVLVEYKLTEKGFHMVDFFNHHHPYSLLSEARYEDLIESLLEIIGDCPRVYVAWSLSTHDYMNVIKARNLLDEDIVRAYHILARRCIAVISDLARAAGHTEKILHIFHHGNSAWPTFEASFTDDMLRALNILRPISQSHTDVVSLQAADVLAHQFGRRRVKKIDGSVETKKVYTDSLVLKPGLDMHIESGELWNAYNDEKYLEMHKHSPGLVRAMREPIAGRDLGFAREMFKPPQEYMLRDELKKLLS